MKNIIDAVATAVINDQLNFEILGVKPGRNLVTTSTLKTIDMVEIRFLLRNLTTGEQTETPIFAAEKGEMIKIANAILECAKLELDPADNRTIN